MSKDLLIPQNLTVANTFGHKDATKIVGDLVSQAIAAARKEAEGQDHLKPAGREAIKSAAYKLSRSKTALEALAKEQLSGYRKYIDTINGIKTDMVEKLNAARDDIKADVVAWETKEKERVQAHENNIRLIRTLQNQTSSIEAIEEAGEKLAALQDLDYQEYTGEADLAFSETFKKLHESKELHEKQAEIAKKEAELAEREAKLAEKEQKTQSNDIDDKGVATKDLAKGDLATVSHEGLTAIYRRSDNFGGHNAKPERLLTFNPGNHHIDDVVISNLAYEVAATIKKAEETSINAVSAATFERWIDASAVAIAKFFSVAK